ncbi:hypothetical protein ACJ73_03870, partial [Blastomyces percursus]
PEEIEVRRLNDQAYINAPLEGATPKPALTTATPNCEAQDAEHEIELSMAFQQFPLYDAPSEDP